MLLFFFCYICKYNNNLDNVTMKKLLLIIALCLPLLSWAKDKTNNSDPKYLAGAVTLTDGKVTFTQDIKTPGISKDKLYDLMLAWAQKRFQSEDDMHSMVAYTNKEKGDIAATAEEYMIFSSSAISLDRTRVYYQFLINVEDEICHLTMTRIRYWYEENRDGGERYSAEEWITDDMALNKKKTKLSPICGKFRRETINLKNALFESAANVLGKQLLNTSKETVLSTTPVQPLNTSEELKDVNFDQLPNNLNELIANGRITITAGEEEIDIKAENWGGFGKLFNKNVTYTLIDQTRIAASALMKQNDTYTLSFYTPGSSKASIVIECKKSMEQNMSAEELKSLNQSLDSSKQYIMYIGEITRILMR